MSSPADSVTKKERYNFISDGSIKALVNKITFPQPTTLAVSHVKEAIEDALGDPPFFDFIKANAKGQNTMNVLERRSTRKFLAEKTLKQVETDFENRYSTGVQELDVQFEGRTVHLIGEGDDCVRIEDVATGETEFLHDTRMCDFRAVYTETAAANKVTKGDQYTSGRRFMANLDSRMGYEAGNERFHWYPMFRKCKAFDLLVHPFDKHVEIDPVNVVECLYQFCVMLHLNEDLEMLAKTKKYLKLHCPAISFDSANSLVAIIACLEDDESSVFVKILDKSMVAVHAASEESKYDRYEYAPGTWPRLHRILKETELILALTKENPAGVAFLGASIVYKHIIQMNKRCGITVTEEMQNDLKLLEKGKLPGHTSGKEVTYTEIHKFMEQLYTRIDRKNGNAIKARQSQVRSEKSHEEAALNAVKTMTPSERELLPDGIKTRLFSSKHRQLTNAQLDILVQLGCIKLEFHSNVVSFVHIITKIMSFTHRWCEADCKIVLSGLKCSLMTNLAATMETS